jgi:hypothetical protein
METALTLKDAGCAHSAAEVFTEGIRACGEAIINLSSDQTTNRAQFAKTIAEFLSWLKNSGTVKPESVPAEASLRQHRPSSSTKESLATQS